MRPILLILAALVTGAVPARTQQQVEPRGVEPKPVVVRPLLIKSVEPTYTAEALKARIAGEVHIAAYIRPDGTVARADVLKSLDRRYGLDRRALEAAREWTFQPGTVNGKPSAFAVTLVLEFSIEDDTAVKPVGVTAARVVGESPRPVAPSPLTAGNTSPQTVDETVVYRPGSGVVNPEILRMIPPKFPAEALPGRTSGSVRLEAVVNPNGTASGFRVLRTTGPEFDLAATDAVRQWLFKPGTMNGKPVRVLTTIDLDFQLEGVSAMVVDPSGPDPSALVEMTPEEFAQGAYPVTTAGLRRPEPLSTPAPIYTPAAAAARIEGDVLVEFVIRRDGTVGRARIAKSLDAVLGLDREALAAVSQWRFSAGVLDGRAVPVVTSTPVQFRLK